MEERKKKKEGASAIFIFKESTQNQIISIFLTVLEFRNLKSYI